MNFPESGGIQRLAYSLGLAVALGVYLLAQQSLGSRKANPVAPELLVSLPRSAQVMIAAGDRYLAADLAGFRVLVADTLRMQAGDYAVQAKLQRDISWFNPAHEDNYYIAAAMLPWNQQLDAAQFVLRRASEARQRDYQPLFYLAFNYFHFLRDPATAAELLLQAASRTSDLQDQWALQNLAARWVERGYQTAAAARIVEAMANNAPPGGFRKYLGMRAQRLRALVRLKELALTYQAQTGRKLVDLEDLVRAGLIERLPKDPFGMGYVLTPDGQPELNRSSSGAGQ